MITYYIGSSQTLEITLTDKATGEIVENADLSVSIESMNGTQIAELSLSYDGEGIYSCTLAHNLIGSVGRYSGFLFMEEPDDDLIGFTIIAEYRRV